MSINKLYNHLLLLIGFCLPISLLAQNPYFSQYYAAPLYLNPALAGAEREISFGVNYRSQWNSNEAPYELSQFSFIYPIITERGAQTKHLGGIGFTAYKDAAGEGGIFKTYGIGLTGSYRIALNHAHTILTGLQAGFAQKKVDLAHLQWGSQYDAFIGFDDRITPSIGHINEQTGFPLFEAGIVWHYTRQAPIYSSGSRWAVFSGLSASNLNQPDESLLKDGTRPLPILMKLHGGLEYRTSRSFKLSPSFLLMMQNEQQQYNIGTYFTYTLISDPFSRQPKTFNIQAGIWRRIKDSYTLMLGGSGRNMAIGLSYDMNTSSMRFHNLGKSAYEISLKYKIDKGKDIRKFSTPLM